MTIDAPRLIAFYLPQYHPIPENDLWWGKGFTDWTNVVRARPVFPGHYQPHVPADLGFYDLRLPEVREAQARMAREYGIHGFCYHYYWFQGRRLLERPFDEVLASGKPDFPFCICWANENWSRRWDGSNGMMLVEQHHSPEDDLRFIESLLPAFRDPRYITVNGKPLLIVYYSKLMPEPAKTAERWRTRVRAAGFPDLYLVRAETHTLYGEHLNPLELGFDAAVEFPPHAIFSAPLHAADNRWVAESDSVILDYRDVVYHSINRPIPDYKLHRGVMPSWDNTARRKTGAYIFAHSSPQLYEQWLSASLRWTRAQHQGEEQLIFINAWNEWAEGCHLEPDLRYGHQFLAATRDTLKQSEHTRSSHASVPDHRTSTKAQPHVSPQLEQLLSENLYLRMRLREIGDTSLPGSLFAQPRTFDNLMAEYLLAGSPRFRRLRRGCYNLLKPIWRTWCAVRRTVSQPLH